MPITVTVIIVLPVFTFLFGNSCFVAQKVVSKIINIIYLPKKTKFQFNNRFYRFKNQFSSVLVTDFSRFFLIIGNSLFYYWFNCVLLFATNILKWLYRYRSKNKTGILKNILPNNKTKYRY